MADGMDMLLTTDWLGQNKTKPPSQQKLEYMTLMPDWMNEVRQNGNSLWVNGYYGQKNERKGWWQQTMKPRKWGPKTHLQSPIIAIGATKDNEGLYL